MTKAEHGLTGQVRTSLCRNSSELSEFLRRSSAGGALPEPGTEPEAWGRTLLKDLLTGAIVTMEMEVRAGTTEAGAIVTMEMEVRAGTTEAGAIVTMEMEGSKV
uniref:Uncharacterized protein n=1 Tax=Knipowitschia caucasica TaxID=637954 RepID=A0AAV2KN34_KNICA